MPRHLVLFAFVFAAVTLHAQDAARLELLIKTLGNLSANPAAQANILKGMRESLQGQRGIAEPKGWSELYAKLKDSPDEQVRAQAQGLAVIFGGGAAMEEMRKKLLDPAAPAEQRRQALDSLVAQRDAGSLDTLLKFAAEPGPLREPALRGLAGYDDPRIAPALTGAFAKLDTMERRAAMQTLLARVSGAKAFTAAIDAGVIPKTELNAPLARQLQGLKDPQLDAWLAKNWGAMNPPSADKQKEIAKYKQFLHPDVLLRADASRGRAFFAQSCAICHTMWGLGGRIGPELTGGYEDVDYLLNNILDPNALIGKDYQQTFVKTKDGQTIAGIVTQDTERAISLKNLAGQIVTVQRSDVASTEISLLSMMPEGLLSPLDEESVRDLFLYLRQKQPVPMLLTATNANDFFTGTDLRNWRPSDPEAWRVEGDEIVGRGGAKPVSVTSELIADDYKLTAQVMARGDRLAAELVLSGERDAEHFHGITLSFGGPSLLNLWDYRVNAAAEAKAGRRLIGDAAWHALEIVRKGETLRVSVDGAVEFELKDPRYRRRVSPAFWLLGEGAELRVKHLKIEAL